VAADNNVDVASNLPAEREAGRERERERLKASHRPEVQTLRVLTYSAGVRVPLIVKSPDDGPLVKAH